MQAAVFSDGSTVKPFRLTLSSKVAGKDGELRTDSSQLGLDFLETAKAQDALLLVGGGALGGGHLASSTSNTFKDVLPGVTLDIKATSTTPATVTVGGSDTTLVATAIAMVDGYNRLRTKLSELTAFDAETGASAVLKGDTTTLRTETALTGLLTTRHFGLGTVQSLQSLGFSLDGEGKLSLDQETLKAKFAEDPQAVEKFLSTEKTGLAAKFSGIVDQLAGDEKSLLGARAASLARKLQTNTEKVTFYEARLEASRNRLLLSFYRSELAIAKIQSNLNSIASIAALPAVQ